MRILKVIHGYPPHYNAGSEVYSQLLASGLSDSHNVEVFARKENTFVKDYHYSTELDHLDPRILKHLINIPRAKFRDKYIHPEVDELFTQVLQKFQPHIVHFGHLNHLSLNLPEIAAAHSIPSIYTLHDFWLMCPRGQFIQRNSDLPWELCARQEDAKCATQCYRGSYSGETSSASSDTAYWTDWVKARMRAVKRACSYISHFIAPSDFLMQKFISEFGIEKAKITHLNYGFDLDRLKNRSRVRQSYIESDVNTEVGANSNCGSRPNINLDSNLPHHNSSSSISLNSEDISNPNTASDTEFVFGYIGTHTPQKGIHILIQAFAKIQNERKTKLRMRLRIWGYSQEDTAALKELAQSMNIDQMQIEWCGGYRNENIINEVFNRVDAIVVPSIWAENSPLVIHEAQQAKVGVITADYGGMAEYVKHLKNGLLFKHRDVNDLAEKMIMFASNRELLTTLSMRGYLYSTDGQVPDIKTHVKDIEEIYYKTCASVSKKVPSRPGPWRITFDTNPDHCNYACVMCECFSPFSKTKEERVAAGIAKRIMPISTIEKVILEAKDTPLREIIPSTMGEPLLYKEFDRIIELCHEHDLKLNLTTNGSFPVKGAEKWARELVPVCSDIKISLNGASKSTNDKIMIGSNWETMLSNIIALARVRNEYARDNIHRCSITFQVTFLETNIHEMVDIVKLALNLGVDRVKGHHLWAHFKEIKDLSMRRNTDSISRWNTVVEEIYNVVDNNLLPNGKKLVLNNIYKLSDTAVEDLVPGGPCPFLGKEAWINTEGKFSPCCAPDKLRETLGYFGNVKEKSLNDIWLGDEYQALRKNYFTHSLCKSCNMRIPLNG